MAKKFLISQLLLVSFISSIKSQDISQSILMSAGRSFHGTGDLPGFLIDFGYQKFHNKRYGYEISFISSFHYGNWTNDALPKNEQLYFVTAGFQGGLKGTLSIFSNKIHRLHIGVGPFLRYEMSSYPSLSGQYIIEPFAPTPLYTVRYEDPRNPFSLGYSVSFRYLVNLSKKNSLGFGIGFQNDTEGSTITNISMVYTREIYFRD